MKPNQAQPGKLYRVIKCPAWEYLTVGEVYECTNQHPTCVGFHRPNGGAGTYLSGAGLRAVEIEPTESDETAQWRELFDTQDDWERTRHTD